ncbi:ABC transporter permease [Streptomyces spiramyceticus]|uniref:ABC transporter permease n=1 Tax=Streptomyces spiramyceticus TaxID=299717 RepID=UPI00237BABBA|nr:FtsX-like permease family protein [Streptomyces spiramyceticus]
MRATLRWAHADLRTHRGEALFIVLATAGIIVSLLLAGALLSYAANPWQRVFTQSRGAHVWIHTSPTADAAGLARLDGVDELAGPYRTARTTVRSQGAKAAVELRGATPEPSDVGRPLITSGRWLDRAAPGGIVLESSLADALWAGPGDTLSVPGARGSVRTLTVVGVADSAESPYRPGDRPGTGWVLSGEPALAGAPGDRLGQVVGLRLDQPDDTDFAVQRAVTALRADDVTEVSSWHQARAEAQSDNRLLGLLLGLFGLGALLAAALAVTGAISTRIRGHLRDIAVLKAIGFTPGQVVRIFLAQHLAFALSGVVLGTVLVETLGARTPGRIGEAVGVWQDLPGHTAALLSLPAATVLFIGAATGLAAWRAGRVPPVPALRAAAPAGGRMSAVARSALGLNVPPALVLGWRNAFRRRARSLSSIARLALPLLLITVALSAWSTLDSFQGGELTARASDGLKDQDVRAVLDASPEVAAAHPGVEVAALVPGQTGTIALRGLGSRTDPYPFSPAEGRAPHGPDEAVAGQGLLDLLDIEVGDWVRMTVGGRPQILHIVGRSIEPENAGRVITTDLDTLRERDPALNPTFYQLRLRPGADARDLDARLEIREATAPAAWLTPARGVVVGLIAVLALIGLTELLTMIGAGVRERERDLPALKAMGLTPRQITAMIVAAAGFTALAAAVSGTALGVLAGSALIDAQGRSNGIGAGIARAPDAVVLLLVVSAAVLGAVAVAALPATRAARRRSADTLAAAV